MSIAQTRREFLQVGGAAAASLALAPWLGARLGAWKDIPIGTQLWCVRNELKGDIPGTLNALGTMGYKAVELENAFGKSGAEWKKYLDAAKLKACGFHHTLEELQGEKLKSTIEFNQAIGNRNLILRWMPEEYYKSAELLKKSADIINEAAAKVRPLGLRVGYHNHTNDFLKVDGEYWWNRFADLTNKDVILQFDTGNASEMQGITPLDFIKRNAGRTVSMHVKPFSKANPNAYLGDDELDWKAIMTACETVGGTEWYIIEYEKEGTPPFSALRDNLAKFLRLRA
jgi:sugar phosphate isomerase/epimerase